MIREDKKYVIEFVLLLISSITGALLSIDLTQTYNRNPNLLNNLEPQQLIDIVVKAFSYVIAAGLGLLIVYVLVKASWFCLKVTFRLPVKQINSILIKIGFISKEKNKGDIGEGIDKAYKKNPDPYNVIITLAFIFLYFKFMVFENRIPNRFVHGLIIAAATYSLLYYTFLTVKKTLKNVTQ